MLRFFIIICAFLIAVQSQGQTFTKVFNGGSDLLQFTNITPAAAGGWMASGIARNNTGFITFISKFDGDGNLLWSQKPDDTRDARALVTLDDGSALVFNNNSGFQGYFDASVLHIGANGNFISEIIWGKPNDQDDWFDAKKLENGDIVAIGMSREDVAFSERVLLAQFSPTGQLVWERTYDSETFGRFGEIIPLPTGEFYALGQNYGGGSFLGVIGKFSANGDIQWIKSYDYGTDATYFLAGQPLPDGSLFVAAYQTNQNGGNVRLTLLNVSNNGTVTTQKSLKSTYDLGPFKMGRLNNDTLLITAVSSGQVLPVVDNDNVILQVSPQGDFLGSVAFGTDGQELGTDAFFNNRQVVLCGMTDSSADGTARRAFISKSGFNISCCEKSAIVETTAPPPLPAINTLSYTASAVPLRQSHTVTLTNFPLSESVTCQNPDGAMLLPPDTILCLGDTLTLSLLTNLPGNVLWSTGATSREILVDAPGKYTVTLTGECGNATDTVTVVEVGNSVTAQVTTVATVCPGESVALEASGGSDFLWYNENGALIFSTANPVITPILSTNYTVVVSDGLCRDTAVVAINILAVPAISAGQDLSIKSGEQVKLSATGATDYTWSPPDGLSCTDCPSPFANPAATTTYTLIGTDTNGCSDTARITVNVQQPCPFYIPNIFSPESIGSPDNHLFGVFSSTISPEAFLLQVYSRWGELVFESHNPLVQWDGTFRNKPAPPGVYWYQLQMNTCDGDIKAKGDLTLIR
jgi:gliding motility-associated-like protein